MHIILELAKLLMVVSILALLMDLCQSIHISLNPERYEERNEFFRHSNVFLPKHPQVLSVMIYFFVWMVIMLAVNSILHDNGWDRIRIVFNTVVIVIEAVTIAANYKLFGNKFFG